MMAILPLVACSDADGAERILRAQGYESIRITGYRFFGCSDDDPYHTGFEAVGPGGQKVSGVVCAGLMFKGGTVRLD